MDDRNIVIHRFAPSGKDDGMLMIEYNTIFRIETNNNYIKKMLKLISLDSYETYQVLNNNNSPETISCLTKLFSLAKQERRIVSIELLNSGITDITGQIQCVSEDRLTIHQINEYGEPDGETICLCNDITQVSIGSETEKIIEKLIQ